MPSQNTGRKRAERFIPTPACAKLLRAKTGGKLSADDWEQLLLPVVKELTSNFEDRTLLTMAQAIEQCVIYAGHRELASEPLARFAEGHDGEKKLQALFFKIMSQTINSP